jgi:hypothetical protein
MPNFVNPYTGLVDIFEWNHIEEREYTRKVHSGASIATMLRALDSKYNPKSSTNTKTTEEFFNKINGIDFDALDKIDFSTCS